MQTTIEKTHKVVALVCAFLTTALGFIFLVFWHLNLVDYLEPPPSINPIPYFAALCLFLDGLALFAILIPRYPPLVKIIGGITFTISFINFIEALSSIELLAPPFETTMPYEMTAESALGYMWASVALLCWTSRQMSSFRSVLPFLLALSLVVGGSLIILSYLISIQIFFISLDASSFNFYGVLGMIFFGSGLILASFYYKVMSFINWMKDLSVLVTIGFIFFAVLVATTFSLERERFIEELLTAKAHAISSIPVQDNMQSFQESMEFSLADDYAFFLYQGEEPIFSINGEDRQRIEHWKREGQVTIKGEAYRFCLYPTPHFIDLFLNQRIIYIILVSGLIIAVSFGSIFHMWQQTQLQLSINEVLQTKLKEAANLQNEILKTAQIGTWKWDIKNDELKGDSHISTLFGMKGKGFRGKYDDFLNQFSLAQRLYLQECKDVSLIMGKPYEASFPVIWPDGSEHHLISKGKVFYDEADNPSYMEGITWDITSIKRTQLFLEVSESVAKLFAEQRSIPETTQQFLEILNRAFGWEVMVLWLLDLKRDVLECANITHVPNISIPLFEKSTRAYPVVRGVSIPGIVWFTMRPYWVKNIAETSGFPREAEEALKGALAFPIFEGSHLMGIIELYKTKPVIEEVDEVLSDLMLSLGIAFGQYLQRKATEEMQGELAAIVTHSHEGMFSLTPEGIVKSWNYGAEEIFGWKSEDVIGQSIAKIYPKSYMKKMAFFFERARLGEAVDHAEIEILRQNGSPIWINQVTSVIRNKQGVVQGYCSLVEDMTERKELEKSKHEFISMISHELRTPLTSIHGAVGLLRVDESQNAKGKELLNVAFRNSERLIELINDILTIEKFELGVLKFELAPASIAELVDDALVTSKALADKRNISFIKEGSFSPDLIVNVDRSKIIQVLLNFLSNAIKFSNQGEPIYVSIEKIDGSVRVSVRDTGKGIPDDFKRSVFGKFSQANMSSTREFSGTGLGLFICKSIIEAMHGKIDFTSQLNQGSTFYFDLQLVQRDKND